MNHIAEAFSRYFVEQTPHCGKIVFTDEQRRGSTVCYLDQGHAGECSPVAPVRQEKKK